MSPINSQQPTPIPELPISEDDRAYVDDCFQCFMLNEYLITPGTKQRTVTADNFPRSFGKKEPDLNDLLADLCMQFQFDPEQVGIEVVDRPPEPPEAADDRNMLPFESDSLIDEEENRLQIYVSRQLIADTDRLIYRLILEFISFHAHLCGAEFEDGDELEYYLHLAAIYYGWGFLTAFQIDPTSEGDEKDPEPEETAIIPRAVFAYALAVFNKLNGDPRPVWGDLLPPRIRELFRQCSEYLARTPDTIFVGERMEALGIQHQGVQLYEQGKYREAITLFEMTAEDSSLSELQLLDVYNMLGFSHVKQEQFPEALRWYQKMVDLSTEEEFGWTELTYVHLRMGHLKTARQYLEHDRSRQFVVPAYLAFNFGYYYFLNGEFEKSEASFLESQRLQDSPIEFWMYHYAELMLATGRRAEGMNLLQQAVKLGDSLALRKLAELGADHRRQEL